MRNLSGFALAGFLLLAACGGKATMLRTQGAAELHCTPEGVVNNSLGPYVEKLSGCGQENVYYYSMNEDRWISPFDRASFDLSCPKEKLQAQHVGGLQVGVTGCGKKAVYVGGLSGWLMNNADNAPTTTNQTP